MLREQIKQQQMYKERLDKMSDRERLLNRQKYTALFNSAKTDVNRKVGQIDLY